MQVIQASALGMCFGVKEALALAFDRKDAEEITILGELVHNESVLNRLATCGYRRLDESSEKELSATKKLLITAHGISDNERQRLKRAGKELIDTTCPLVRRVHEAARKLEARGYHVVVIGRRGHVELRGIVGDLKAPTVVTSAEEVTTLPHAKIGVIAQSTCMQRTAEDIVRAIAAKNPQAELRWIDTICEPTKLRVLALEELLSWVDAVVVVGGSNSNNTRQLVKFVEEREILVFHIQDEQDLDPADFAACEIVGLTAGTSTPDWTIARVKRALQAIPAVGGSGSQEACM